MNDFFVSHLQSPGYIPSPHHLPPLTLLQDRYTVGHVLGEGGFGIIYLGYDRRLELPVAIKEYFPITYCTRNAGAGPQVTVLRGLSEKHYARGRQNYQREAGILARLEKQPVVVGVRDYFEENNTAYIVMEYIDGINLSQRVKELKGFSPEELFSLFRPLFGTLAAIHAEGLLHRDICPENIMIEKGKIRLMDFGCAREAAILQEVRTITLHHGYAPIEQYQHSGGQGPWTDIYSLCATMYFCLTGTTPPLATDRITRDTLIPPRDLGVQISEEQEKAILKGMRVRPHQRCRTVEDLKAALYDKESASVHRSVSEC